MTEVWRGALYGGIDYSCRFEVSTLGRIRNATTKHIYTPNIGRNGYYRVCTSVFGRNRNFYIHRFVAETFLPNPAKWEIVNHLDGNKLNNRIDNLEWCTRSGNYHHAVQMGLISQEIIGHFTHKVQIGCDNGRSKLNESIVRYVRANYIPKSKGQKCNRKELATTFGVSVGLISQIVNRDIWKEVY